MVRKPSVIPPPVPNIFTTEQEIERAIAKIAKRIDELERLDVQVAFHAKDGSVEIIESNIRNTIRDVFGEGSPEFQEHQYIEIWSGSLYINMPEGQRLAGVVAGRKVVLNVLKGLVERLKEKAEDLRNGSSPKLAEGLGTFNLHPRILDVVEHRFRDGHHWDAVFAASKALVHYVKERSGLDLDGAKLMYAAFSKNNPVLAFNDLSDQTDQDEQEGMMHLFVGAVLAIRNPGGHSFPEGSEQRALEYINFLSMLAYRVQEAKRPKRN